MKGQLSLLETTVFLPVLSKACTAALGRSGWKDEPKKPPAKEVR